MCRAPGQAADNTLVATHVPPRRAAAAVAVLDIGRRGIAIINIIVESIPSGTSLYEYIVEHVNERGGVRGAFRQDVRTSNRVITISGVLSPGAFEPQ